ncbi:lipopolysaccharide transport periplasmic protein LptA [Aestuariirhabdus sp. Z084]|uniref:lipopolysaccharide transport periplasmic protein LptA n=1 Tax=Aestuariirhabdus haliotis TaxID=2918751 RepID=UPI00201B4501|nr:lipopolysaccharide transport periplasmic protein LptA [Aestuariirhabdus haliotis]MCL6415229.1 lipopolysaccharide transport periplasmic protein LptA [Aestuariirhabdus haliotis]MCL6419489.1 lipopolysaccharide transport periplasmic protein LptA [Aestuariirhabdus haliotis]
MSTTKPLLVLLFSTLLASTGAQALPEDQEQPIRIKADKADIDEGAGRAIYTGSVTMDQGSIHITGDKVTIYTKAGAVTRMVAEGTPAHYQEKPAVDKEIIKAYGNTIDYAIAKDKVKLIKNAKLFQEGNSFTGDVIHYNMKTQAVNAQGATSRTGKNRVEMVIQPKSKQ